VAVRELIEGFFDANPANLLTYLQAQGVQEPAPASTPEDDVHLDTALL
jgi:hypothetical protein